MAQASHYLARVAVTRAPKKKWNRSAKLTLGGNVGQSREPFGSVPPPTVRLPSITFLWGKDWQ